MLHYYYFMISLVIFSLYLVKFVLDSSTNKNDLTSWLALLIALFFWPILLPVSSWELTKKSLQKVSVEII
jgi:hypothetical protein